MADIAESYQIAHRLQLSRVGFEGRQVAEAVALAGLWGSLLVWWPILQALAD